MTLELIGAGFGRTGTLAQKVALEKLGLAPCHHMLEVFAHPEQVPGWHDAARARPVDLGGLLAGYRACVDWPACNFWRELAGMYPDAKVLLSVRDSAKWYASARDTIYQVVTGEVPKEAPESLHAHLAMVREMIFDGTFGGRFEDEAHARSIFEAHNQAVIDAIPAERLLVYEVSQGWEPLCRFLDVAVPDEPFPHINTRDEFRDRLAAAR